MIQAIIDIGSNTVRMAIYDIEGRQVEMIMKKKNMVGLASYLKNGVMEQQGIDKVCEVLDEYRAFLQSFRITAVVAFTTAALRNASNSCEAVAEIVRRTQIPVRVITGDEEATFDFIGATHDVSDPEGLLIDIGGASTEIVYYKQHQILRKVSLLVGSLALKTKYVQDILPTGREIAAMQDEVGSMLKTVWELKGIRHASICGIGGTFKGACALYNLLFKKRRENLVMQAQRFSPMIDLYRRDREMSAKDTIRLMKAVPERLHTIIPGLVIADVLAKHFQSDKIIYSDSGVREGYIYDQLLK